jgi:putative heme transporter
MRWAATGVRKRHANTRAATRRLQSTRRAAAVVLSWGGPRLTWVLCALAFVAVANLLGGGLRFVYGAGDQHHALRLVADLVASVVLSAVALARVRSQWGRDSEPPAPIPVGDEEREPHAGRSSIMLPPWLRVARWVLIAGLTGVAVVTIVSQWGTLESAFGELKHIRWGRLRWAIYAEALAMIAFAQLTRLLLRAGKVNLGLGSMIGLTLASNAVALTLPGGPAWAATFSYDQLRRRGVRRSLTAYALALTWVLSAVALVVIALVGIDLAGNSAPAAPFRIVATVCTVALGLAGIAGALALRVPRIRAALARLLDRLCESSRWGKLGGFIRGSQTELSQVRLPAPLLLRSVAAAVLNWIFDCGCLVFSILAVGGHVPWQGVLAAYGLTQLAAALPLTPGGIGVVEGTLSVLLIAYHMPAATAMAGVILYRIISFWVLVPVGWGAVGILLAMQRRGRVPGAWIGRARHVRGPRTSVA